jgi:nucleoside-diphosphate-sugar epimerase
MKVLVLGGTKYLGLQTIYRLIRYGHFELSVASRSKVENINVKYFDRKSLDSLVTLLKEPFDLIIDFICFTMPDANKLINALRVNNSTPKIIMISTTYVYNYTLETNQRNEYAELDFLAEKYAAQDLDWPVVGYVNGKRSAEAVLNQEYPSDKLCIIRFPIILGNNDPTGRTAFFLDVIKNDKSLNLGLFSGKSNYISVQAASNSICSFANNFISGTFNVALAPEMNQRELFYNYCQILGVNPLKYLDESLELTISPFYYERNLIINSEKYYASFPHSIKEMSLLEELKLILA